MKIKLAILDKDLNYLTRVSAALSGKYADQLELYTFSDLKTALQMISSAKIDVFLVNEEFDAAPGALPRQCGFARIVETPGISTLNGETAVFKFQRAELLYRQVLGIFAERNAGISESGAETSAANIVAFSSPAGGVGTSTLSAACAINFAAQGRRTLYLCLDPFGSADLFFTGEGQSDLSDIIFALKSKKTNMAMKLESCVKRSASGVFFYSEPKVALDLFELSDDEIVQLVNDLRQTGGYEYIVLDLRFDMSGRTRNIFRQAQKLVWVSDGSELANHKIYRAYKSLEICELNEEYPLTNRLCLAYNRFSSKTGRQIEDLPVESVGGAPRFENRTTEQVVRELAKSEILGYLAQD